MVRRTSRRRVPFYVTRVMNVHCEQLAMVEGLRSAYCQPYSTFQIFSEMLRNIFIPSLRNRHLPMHECWVGPRTMCQDRPAGYTHFAKI
jgi:hypothetical protein